MTNKEKYRQLCLAEPSIPIYSKDWWLDATSLNGDWDVAIYEEDGVILGTWCYFFKIKLGFKIITTPLLTKYQGIWFKNNDYELGKSEIITNELIKQLPNFSSLTQYFSTSYTNWLPLYWNKFKQSTRYTFVIEDLTDLEKVYNNFSFYRKKAIRKAQKSYRIEFGYDASQLFELMKKNLFILNEKISFSKVEFVKLIEACEKNNSGQAILCLDSNNQIVCFNYIVWDNLTTHYILSSYDAKICKNGVTDFLLYETIKFASTKTKEFDFEGSMNKGIAYHFNYFTTKKNQYFMIYKSNLFFKIYNLLKYN